MSGNHSALATMTFLVAIALAANYADQDSAGPRTPRTPAALSKKEMILGGVDKPLFRHTDKIRGPVEAAVELIGMRPEAAGDVFVLRGLVTSDLPLTDVDFKWSLPPGVELINGAVRGRIAVLAAGKPAEVQLTLKTLTGENHQVHLIASASRGGTRFAQSVQYNTLLESVLETGRKDLQKSTAESAETEGSGKVKIFH